MMSVCRWEVHRKYIKDRVSFPSHKKYQGCCNSLLMTRIIVQSQTKEYSTLGIMLYFHLSFPCTVTMRWWVPACHVKEVGRWEKGEKIYLKRWAICNNMNRPWGHYAKWNNSDRERQVGYDLTSGILKNKTKPKPNL